MARGPSGPAFNCLSAQFSPLWRAAEQASWSFAFLLNLPPFWCAARAGQLLNALLLFIECGPSGPAYHLRGPSGPVCHLLLCLIATLPDPCEKHSMGGGRLIILWRVAASCARRVKKLRVTAPGFTQEHSRQMCMRCEYIKGTPPRFADKNHLSGKMTF